jgi:hypothetical protein
MTKRILSILTAIILITATSVFAATIFDGYEDLPWGSHLHKVMNTYPKGHLDEYNKEIIYTQDNPDETIASRLFAFKGDKLSAVAVTLNADYVKKTGLENLKQKYIKQYGKGNSGGQGSSHMVSYVWESKKTRVSFVYIPNRPEMTVLQFEQK